MEPRRGEKVERQRGWQEAVGDRRHDPVEAIDAGLARNSGRVGGGLLDNGQPRIVEPLAQTGREIVVDLE